MINSFYGQLGFRHALFNDFAAADQVARTGQHILRQMMTAIRERGGTVIEVDTDGVFFVPPPEVVGAEAEQVFMDELMCAVPAGIRLGYAGRFRHMLSYKMKNYALLSYDGSLQYKGSSLVSRAVEPFGRRFILDAIALLLQEDVQGLHDLYIATHTRLLQHAWRVEDFARTETLKETPQQYQADIAAGRRSRAAAYELAMARARHTGQPVRKGDRISYYVTGPSANVTTFDHARLAEGWDPASPDENTAYYLKRLDECTRRFTTFFTADDFQRIFTADGLFRFSAIGMSVCTHVRAHTTTVDS